MLVILLACMQAPQEAKNIQLEGKPLNEAIAAMESRLEVHEKEVAQDMLVLMNRMKKVEDRLKTLEIVFTDIRPQSYSAQDISFVPTATKISSTQLQGALEEIEKRLREVELNASADPNQPGQGLFDLVDHGKRKTDKGKPKHGPNQEGQGPNGPNGPKGPPPNGQKGPAGPPP